LEAGTGNFLGWKTRNIKNLSGGNPLGTNPWEKGKNSGKRAPTEKGKNPPPF